MKITFESIVNKVIIALCILVAIADLLDLFENIPFIAEKIPAITLSAIGLIAIYLNVENRNRKKETEAIVNKYATNIIDEINIDDNEHNILSKINNIWAERDHDINLIMDKITSKSAQLEYEAFLKYLHEIQTNLWNGYIFNRPVSSPIDFTLTAVSLTGEFVYHPSDWSIARDVPLDSFYGHILKNCSFALFYLMY